MAQLYFKGKRKQMSEKFPIGSKWVTAFGNGYLIVTIGQVDRYYINDKAYSKIRFLRIFYRFEELFPLREKEAK